MFTYNQQNNICNFIHVFICFFSIFIGKYNISSKNIICNSVGELTIAVIFVVIIFQLSEIYRPRFYIGNPVNNK